MTGNTGLGFMGNFYISYGCKGGHKIKLRRLQLCLCTDYKFLLLNYKAIHNLAFSYYAKLLEIHTPSNTLKSSPTFLLLPTPPSPSVHRGTFLAVRSSGSGTHSHWTYPLYITSENTVHLFRLAYPS